MKIVNCVQKALEVIKISPYLFCLVMININDEKNYQNFLYVLLFYLYHILISLCS